ncbi:MAG: DUF465 domain-containing protein [Alphaproteobacteria bacterium]|nr:DUF465 domain-containing protein [Alphaproteobacteria bacterium]
MTHHTESLEAKHAALELQIEKEIARPHPNDLAIADLKRQKLKIKEDLELLETT